MSYSTYQALETYLGLTFSNAQRTQATGALAAATSWIDRYTGRSWQAITPVTDEQCNLLQLPDGSLRCYVERRPTLTVTSVKTRGYSPTSSISTLASGDYELLDGTTGLVAVSGGASLDTLALVSYTHAQTSAPADVQIACQMIAGSWMAASLHPDSVGVRSISVGQNDLSVTYAEDGHRVPPEALDILNLYRRVVIV